MVVSFERLDTEAGVDKLNAYLADKSYIDGHVASAADVSVFEQLKSAPASGKFPHAARWYKHIGSHTLEDVKAFSGVKAAPAAAKAAPAKAASPKKAAEPKKVEAKKEEDEDELDLFGSDDEVDEEAEKIKAERLAAYQAKKSAKPKVIAKSSIVLDVKPWDDETDMKALEAGVRAIEMPGLLWGASKLVPIGFGIKKLQIGCVVEDDKVSTDDLEERIVSGLEDFVQSMDVAAFQKI